MARFKNISAQDRHVGRPDGRVVRSGEVTAADGTVTAQTDEAYIVGEGEDARAWPKSTWELIPEPAAAAKGRASEKGDE